jgi:Domain of unknown function (DUF4209)
MSAFLKRLATPKTNDDVTAAGDIAAGLEEATPGRLRDLGQAMRSAADAIDRPAVSDLLRLEAGVLLLEFGGANWTAHWGQPLIPGLMIDGDAFEVTDPPDSAITYAERRTASERHDVAARWNDLRWLRWRHFPAVALAIDAYLAHAARVDVNDIEQVMDSVGGITRACDLSLRLDQQRPEVCAAVRTAIRRWITSDLTMPILEVSTAARAVLSVEPEQARQLAEELTEVAGRNPDPTGADQLLESAEKIAGPSGAPELVSEIRRRRGALFEHRAASSEGLGRVLWLRDAIRLYGEAGDGTSLGRAQRAYEAAGLDAQQHMQTVGSTVTIGRGDIEAQVDALTLGRGPSLQGFLYLPAELGFWNSWQTVREDRRKEEAKTPFLSMATRIGLEADGRIQPEPDAERDPDSYERARDISFFGRHAQWRAGLFDALLVELRNRGVWTSRLVTTAIAIVDRDVADACAPGLDRFENGDHWTAAHVLVPQIERILRVLGREIGADRSRFASHQGLRWASFESLLADDGVIQVMGADVAAAMTAVFSDEHGPNFRNDVAHGALATDVEPNAAAILAIMAILAVCYSVALARRRSNTG